MTGAWKGFALRVTLLVFPIAAFGDPLTISGGIDLRVEAGAKSLHGQVKGVFLNLRQIISSPQGDRWVFVLQTDVDDNLSEVRLYQTYAQLKGPLGRWNLRAGRYLVPFGLLSSYDTERLVLRTMEPLSLSVKLDEGIQVHGFTQDFDYALSLTDGMRGKNPIFIARIGQEAGEATYGWSLLIGRLPEAGTKESVESVRVLPGFPLVQKVRLGFDYTLSLGPDLWRAELIAGTDNGHAVGGGYVEFERALNPHWSLNLNAGYWRGSEARWRLGIGATRNLGGGHFARLGLIHRNEPEGSGNEVVLQYYWEFARQR